MIKLRIVDDICALFPVQFSSDTHYFIDSRPARTSISAARTIKIRDKTVSIWTRVSSVVTVYLRCQFRVNIH